MADLVKPAALRRGDTIAVVSPAWAAAASYKIRFQHGVEAFERICGLRVRVMPNALAEHRSTAGTRAQRIADLHEAFADPAIAGIVCATGGRQAVQLPQELDYELIRQHPKVFCGYSDITVLNHAIHAETGLVTFSGPMIVSEWAEWTGPDPRTVNWFTSAVMSTEPLGAIAGADTYTDERVSWARPRDRARRRRTARPYRAIRPGVAEGSLLPGTLTNVCELLGTEFEPDFRDTILVLDTPGGGFGPDEAERQLWHLRNAGVFDDIRGLALGRPYHLDAGQTDELHRVLLEVSDGFDFPVLGEVDHGLTDPQLTLPLGCRTIVDHDRLIVAESGVR